jgi:hypothetical protein
MLCAIVKYWSRIWLTSQGKSLKCCYELQIRDLKCEGWAVRLRGDLYKTFWDISD